MYFIPALPLPSSSSSPPVHLTLVVGAPCPCPHPHQCTLPSLLSSPSVHPALITGAPPHCCPRCCPAFVLLIADPPLACHLVCRRPSVASAQSQCALSPSWVFSPSSSGPNGA